MATSSQVKAGLDDIARRIRDQRQIMVEMQGSASAVSTALGGMPDEFSDVIATINAFDPETTDQFELLAKAELANMAAEFTALKAHADTVAALDLDNGS